jgi:hypothetical protein
MATFTSDFPTTRAPRSRAERFSDGVVAGYINALAQAAAPSKRPDVNVTRTLADRSSSAAMAELATGEPADAEIQSNQALGRSASGSHKRSLCWNRGGRAGFSLRTPCLSEAR